LSPSEQRGFLNSAQWELPNISKQFDVTESNEHRCTSSIQTNGYFERMIVSDV
jgi:hypothetical protein